MSTQEMQYTAKDLAASLDVTTSTLRRWAIALEGAHYLFERNEKGQRIYTEQDIATLEELKRLLGEKLSFADAIQQLTGHSQTKEQKAETKKLDITSEELEKLISQAVKKAVKKEREKLFKQVKKQMKKEMEKLKDKS
ncbi:DNA-binding transcriptional regulator, MerR family [Terribacillus halophilus]|uniref:DNA-binding transcriptional regulator, MerR family n=1 Tax=Terribacillus halophilus TaxID=361279 RepID=A0A1G6TZQ9_9BACI|nr:helix-turn-helix domain-containing protein [Terribacillus halophilus]SDD34579.1 DNA-binding transcriptional regulator, MerR family [Terribacillus halophilus]